MRKLASILAAAVLVATGLLSAPATTAQAATSWYDGAIKYSYINNCATSAVEMGVGTYVGYAADPGATYPAPGDVYWLHIYAAGMGMPCGGGSRVMPNVILPANTVLAIDATHKLTCYTNHALDTADCPSTLTTGGYNGGLMILSPDTAHARTWPLPQGGNYEWQIPVVSDRPLTNELWGVFLQVLDGNSSPTLLPTANAYVYAKNPAITYPSPATTGIGDTAAVSKANVYSGGLAGTGYFDIGTTTSYGLFTDSVAIPAGGPNWVADTNWTPSGGTSVLRPGTTYHWRLRYVVGSYTYYGADQTFTTTGTAGGTGSGGGSGSGGGTGGSGGSGGTGGSTGGTGGSTGGTGGSTGGTGGTGGSTGGTGGTGGSTGGGSTVTSPASASVAAWTLTSKAKVSWKTTSGAKPSRYDVRYRVATFNGGYSAFKTWKSKTKSKSAKLTLKLGTSYCFSSRARYANGTLSEWSAETCTSTPLDDRKLVRSGTWKSEKVKAAVARTVSTSTAAGGSLTARGAQVKRLALVYTRGAGFGSVTVTVGGTNLGTFSLAGGKKTKAVLTLPALGAAQTGDVVITTTGVQKVVIDALLLSRQ